MVTSPAQGDLRVPDIANHPPQAVRLQAARVIGSLHVPCERDVLLHGHRSQRRRHHGDHDADGMIAHSGQNVEFPRRSASRMLTSSYGVG